MDSNSGRSFGMSRGAAALLLLAIFVALLGSTLRAAEREPVPSVDAGANAASSAAMANAAVELAAADDAFIAAAPSPPPAQTLARTATAAARRALALARETEDNTSLPAVGSVGEVR
jgi:hypothetical protein